MPWAIFHAEHTHDFRPERAVSITIQPSEKPQEYPSSVIDGAVKAKKAKKVDPPTAAEKRAAKGA